MKCHYKLKIDPEFEALVPPLTKDEYTQLEANILHDGCREPITIWNNVILDGHNRYRICLHHHIPFEINSIRIESRDEAIAWICSNQMGRRNITEERRRYLIGKRYEAEKRIGAMNLRGINQYSEVRPAMWVEARGKVSSRRTSRRLGNEYHLSPSTVEKYSKYARALDRISEVDRRFTDQVLAGNIRLSCENVTGISQLTNRQIQTVTGEAHSERLHHLNRDQIIEVIRNAPVEAEQNPRADREVSVKDMPIDDPDAGISSLALTVPSWRSTIERVHNTFDFQHASSQAKIRLIAELSRLKHTIDEIIAQIEEEH